MEKMKLSPQAVGSIMLAVQRGLMAAASGRSSEECDITRLLLNFELQQETTGLIVMNPPMIEAEME